LTPRASKGYTAGTEPPMPEMRIVKEPISRTDLAAIATERFGDLVKAVVDVRLRLMAIGGELHADEEQALLEQGSAQADLWGINLYPERQGEDWLEYDSMINIRPSAGNRSREVEEEGVRKLIKEIVAEKITG